MKHRYALSALLILALTGCANNAEPAANTAGNSTSASSESNTAAGLSKSPPPSAVEQLSAGQATQITTSQGTITLVPTVVDMQPLAADTAATVADNPEPAPLYYDPLEGWNRGVFRFNHVAYTYALIPLAKGYEKVLPAPVRDKVGNAFANIREPLNLLNNVLAGDVKGASANFGRFVINSTVGIFGLFDPANAWFEIAESKQSIADTLGYYQVGNGAYLVLPILGQSDVRGATSVVGEALLNPLNQLVDTPDLYYLQGLNVINSFTSRADLYQTLYQQASDPYLYFRNQHLQGIKRDDAYVKPE
ncbi:hypothetical protein VT06_14390 [Arsukibacterium sp. MJ3]|uniref:MlaA family lipoprotein n=1 Tax=Arsukibacterium sp. MJ3 TaxID=1632859 RepID=UPI000627376B|nr:VacJ family lipoprotein [Arsukibacterium sp. MJ3]KKO47971.1 hypothetical protein VT06_14390 [Arsukibacterium sp. MJ3]